MSWEASNAALSYDFHFCTRGHFSTRERENCVLVGTIRSDYRIGGRI